MTYLFAGLIVCIIVAVLLWTRHTRLERHVKRVAGRWGKKPVHNWNEAFLESKRYAADPYADEIVRKIMETGETEHINGFYEGIHRTSEHLPEGMPDYIKDFFNKTADLPPWADPHLIKRGEEFYMVHGPTIGMVLVAKSLPECYACAKGAMVLYRTGRLSEKHGGENPFTRRVAETSQFIINCMAPGGLSPNGQGIRSAQKIRLIHGAIRYYLYKDGWDEEQYGKPINQEDMAGTLMSFAPLVLEGLERLGFHVSEEEKEAYTHCWRVVGYFMGLNEDLLPNNAKDAHLLGTTILNRQKAKSEQGTHLTKSLIEFMSLMSKNGEVNLVVDDLIRMMIGDPLADMLEVPKVSQGFEKESSIIARELVGGWENLEDRHFIIRSLTEPLNKMMMEGMLRLMNHGEKIRFFIPPSLQGDWGLKSATNT